MTDLIQPADLAAAPVEKQAPADKRSNAIKLPKELLTDKRIKSLLNNKTRAAPGQRYTIWDQSLDGFGVRITDKHLSYIFAGRFPGSKHWTRREIGVVGVISLIDARAKAKRWIELVEQGKDPRVEMERLEKEEARKQAHTFAAVAEEFIVDRVIGPNNPDPDNPVRPIQRKWKWVCRTIRDPFIATWKETPIANITRDDVLALIRKKKRTAPAEARSQLAIIKSLFTWALNQSYGLERSVCTDIKPKDIIGDKTERDRTLSDDEVKALWNIANQTEYPIGPIYKMLMLSSLRLNEVVRAEWSEFDLAKKIWVIPAARMKGKNTGSGGKKARPHLVPLTAQMIEILDSLPRFKHGDWLFSTTKGKKPLWVGSKVKDAIDVKMLQQLQQIAADRGNLQPLEPIIKIGKRKFWRDLPWWTNHDIRRTIRTNLSALKDPNGRPLVQEEVKEAIIAHAKTGIVKVYDVYRYDTEKREALEAWAARLAEIVNPQAPEPQPEPESGNVLHPNFGKAMTQ